MTIPVVGRGWEETGPSGYTYAAVLLRVEGTGPGRPEVLAALGELRFSGWLAPAGDDGWVVIVAGTGDGTVAAGRRGVLGVGEWLSKRFTERSTERVTERATVPVLAVRVVDDRQLVLASWVDGEETGRYVSDPSWGLDRQEGVLPDPVGVECADAFAAACLRPETAEELAELLAEELDTDSVIESERLAGVLRLLGLPHWLVASASLPGDIAGGPRARDLTRLGAGLPGAAGRLCGWAVGVVRRRRPPPPVLADPPRGGAGADPWLF
jgi:hypothetical protein